MKLKITLMLAVILTAWLLGCKTEKSANKHNPKYKVLIGEYWGGYEAYYCDDFKVINGTYVLYDRQDNIIASLTAGEKHVVRAELNR